MAEIKSGSEAAKEVGVALAVLYNYIRSGKVKNLKAGGWPSGKGIEVDMVEVRAAKAAADERRAGHAPRAPKGSRKAKEQIQGELEAERETRARSRAREQNAAGDNPHAVRLHRYQRGEARVCPVDPSHNAMIKVEGAKKGDPPRWQCTHQAHDGRGQFHPGGPAPQSQAIFTEEEISAVDHQVGRLGQVMLEWIYTGRTDLAEDLETWLVQHELPVWIPAR